MTPEQQARLSPILDAILEADEEALPLLRSLFEQRPALLAAVLAEHDPIRKAAKAMGEVVKAMTAAARLPEPPPIDPTLAATFQRPIVHQRHDWPEPGRAGVCRRCGMERRSTGRSGGFVYIRPITASVAARSRTAGQCRERRQTWTMADIVARVARPEEP